ncbi:MAG: type II secretion system protein GspK [Gammaproteobacteria bacterium]|nr:type II secretion system protein GspK [Gammaproteobacteria bacterium]
MATRSEGFVLVATLWVLAGLTILAGYVDGVTTDSVERATLARQALQRELDRRNTKATLVYLLATNRKNHRALVVDNEQRFVEFVDEQLPPGDAEVALTGQAYAGLGEINFAIQDEAGMVPVNAPNAPQLAAMLRHVGVSAQDAVRVVARVSDYVDIDVELTLNGAEHFDYVRRGLPPPPNWLMASPLELKKVLGLEQIITDEQWRRLRPVLTMRQGIGLNVSTMPSELIAALLDADERAVRDIMGESGTRPLDASRLMQLAGWAATIDPEELRVLPADHLRITTWYAGGARHVAGIHLTPYVDGAAWRQDYRYTESPVDGAASATSPISVSAPLLQ